MHPEPLIASPLTNTMSAFKKPPTLNLGDMDLRTRITSICFASRDQAEWRAAAVKRYKGYLYDSMHCVYAYLLKQADHRSRNIALGLQGVPSQRAKRLLSALPRLATGAQQDALAEPECYFSIRGGWERWVWPMVLPASPEPTPEQKQEAATRAWRCAQIVDYNNWYWTMSQEAGRAGMPTEDYIAVTQANLRRMQRQEEALRQASEARIETYWRSVHRECTILDNLAHNMQATYVDFVIVPMYQEWRMKCANAALEQARAERTRREAWAIEFLDTRRLVSEAYASRHSVIILSPGGVRCAESTVSMDGVRNSLSAAFPISD
jgi:hypothetical protein